MKKLLFMLTAVLVLLSSCKTKEKVLYLQDVTDGETFNTQVVQSLKVQSGDRLTIVVTSSATPQIAQQFNLPVLSQQVGLGTGSNQMAYYTVDENGDIDFPTLGRLHMAGLTRSEVASKIQALLRDGQLNDAIVTVNVSNQYVIVMGEVSKPGRVNITNDNLTILDAIGQSGDLTIQAKRSEIKVIRQEGTQTKVYYVDLRSKSLFNSPVYNLKQNDIVYVSPNKVKMGQSTNNDNSLRSISTWLSISSFLLSLAILIFRK